MCGRPTPPNSVYDAVFLYIIPVPVRDFALTCPSPFPGRLLEAETEAELGAEREAGTEADAEAEREAETAPAPAVEAVAPEPVPGPVLALNAR